MKSNSIALVSDEEKRAKTSMKVTTYKSLQRRNKA